MSTKKLKIVWLLLSLLLAGRLITGGVTSSGSPEKVAPFPAVAGKISQIYTDTLPYKEGSLLSGIVLGRIGLDRQFKARLANVGLTHVVAASGMNLTLFSGFIVWLVTILKLSRIYKVIVSLVFILLYSALTGFEPPIVRAGLMIGVSYLAMLSGRQRSGFWGLVWTAYLMLWAQPSLLTNASFLLSFSAMTSQIFLSSFLAELPKRPNFIEANFWQSFLAILFTAPIVLWFFAKFSLISLVSNVLTLWTVEPLMLLGGVVALSGLVSLPLARVLALPAEPLLAFFLWVVDFLNHDVFLFRFQLSSPLFVVGYYLALGGFVWWWTVSKRSVD